MKLATWNVNSLRVRLPQVLEWLAQQRPDVLALQEIKCTEPDFPAAALAEAGYVAACSGQRTYNGVAILSREAPDAIETAIPGYADEQRRVLAARIGGVYVIDLYVPNGESVESPKYRYKLEWLQHLHAWLAELLQRERRVIVVGDFNIAPAPEDVHDPVAWEGRVLYSAPERAAFQGLLDLGLCDTFRRFAQAERVYSWWDYRANAFRRNLGLRIDHILASAALCEVCTRCSIDPAPRRQERPSDHAPVTAEFVI